MEYVAKRGSRVARAVQSRVPVLEAVLSRPLGALGLAIVALFVFTALFAPLLAPYDYVRQDIPHRLLGPSPQYPLGTDELGRDLLSRIIYGSRVAVTTASLAIAIAITGGFVLGLAAGFLGGYVDDVIILLMDSVQTFPGMILILAILALLGPSLANLILIIGITWIPGYARVVRAQVLGLRQNLYIEAERSLGAGDLRIILVHVLPNVAAPILILAAMDLPSVVVMEAGLSLIGMGLNPPSPSWGVILSSGFVHIRVTPWPILWSGLALALITLGFTLLGEALRDALDPKLAEIRRA
jgi:peptide/nickel transport system permease protein